MADLYQILTVLRDEVEQTVIDLTPTSFPQKRFCTRQIPERDNRSIYRCEGRERLCELLFQPMESPTYTWVGSQTRGIRLTVPLVIVYPDLANWLISAHADWDQIAHELNTNKPTITGLHLREVDINQPKTLTPHGDDPWQFLTIPISIICETDN